MHDSVMAFGRRHLTADVVAGRTVVEFGSLNVNGSLREVVEPLGPKSYTGVDQFHGPGVDVVGDITSFAGRGDIVICTEVLEHAEDWRAVALAMMASAKTLLLVTTRGPGFPYHGYPGDHWRFTLDDFAAIFAGLNPVEVIEDPYPGHPGVLALYRKPRKFEPGDLSGIDVEPAPTP